ncbi:MAG: hypothetical protein V3T77_04870, partial [Planctomycetota bacterium]
MRRQNLLAMMSLSLFFLSGCANYQTLQEENNRLREEIESLRAQLEQRGEKPTALTNIRTFTVGLAAAQSSFSSEDFVSLLMYSLKEASQDSKFRVARESDDRQASKVRGMLVQQYLAAEAVPISISNLSYKLQDTGNDFKIGERMVPSSEVKVSIASPGGPVHVSHAGPINAFMRRDSHGQYTVSYEELGGGKGSIPIKVRDVEILDSDQNARSARQGDLSFNW